MLPPLLVIHEKYLADRGPCPKKTTSRRMSKVYLDNNKGVQDSQHYVKNSLYGEASVGCLDEFLSRQWNLVVKVLRWMIFVVFLAWAGYATYACVASGSDFKNDKVHQDLFVDTHANTKLMKMVDEQFESREMDFSVEIFWGVKGINRENANRWSTQKLGEAIMDEQFDLSSKESQQSITDFCKSLRSQPFCASVDCQIDTFSVWNKRESGRNATHNNLGFDRQIFKWAHTTQEGRAALVLDKIGFINGKLKYHKIIAKSSDDYQNSVERLEKMFKKWDTAVSNYKLNEQTPVELKSVTHVAGKKWLSIAP